MAEIQKENLRLSSTLFDASFFIIVSVGIASAILGPRGMVVALPPIILLALFMLFLRTNEETPWRLGKKSAWILTAVGAIGLFIILKSFGISGILLWIASTLLVWTVFFVKS